MPSSLRDRIAALYVVPRLCLVTEPMTRSPIPIPINKEPDTRSGSLLMAERKGRLTLSPPHPDFPYAFQPVT